MQSRWNLDSPAIMDDEDAMQAERNKPLIINTSLRSQNEAKDLEIRSLKREIKKLNKSLDYVEMKARIKAQDKADYERADKRKRQFSE